MAGGIVVVAREDADPLQMGTGRRVL